MMQVSKKIPFEDPQVLMAVRVLYVVSNLVIIGMYLYAQQKINKKKGVTLCDLRPAGLTQNTNVQPVQI